jgi:hypothetical protein
LAIAAFARDRAEPREGVMGTKLAAAFAGTVFVALCGTVPAQAACRFHFRWNTGPQDEEVGSRMVVRRDTICKGRHRLGKRDPGSFVETRFPRPPQHGVAGSASRYEYAYRPAPGYVGKDAFDMLIVMDMDGKPRHILVHFDVTVR